jgi:hypothetical protein
MLWIHTGPNTNVIGKFTYLQRKEQWWNIVFNITYYKNIFYLDLLNVFFSMNDAPE